SMEHDLSRRGDLARRQVELAHPLVHHADPVLGILGDVAARIVLVARGPEDAALLAREGARRHAALGEPEAQVAILVALVTVRLGIDLAIRAEARASVDN